jgi:hypothetical protein
MLPRRRGLQILDGIFHASIRAPQDPVQGNPSSLRSA